MQTNNKDLSKIKRPELLGVGEYAFTSDKGYDFFVEDDLTQYARKRGFGKRLLGWTVYVVCMNGEPVDRVLFNRKNVPVYNSPNLEAMSMYIDALRFALK